MQYDHFVISWNFPWSFVSTYLKNVVTTYNSIRSVINQALRANYYFKMTLLKYLQFKRDLVNLHDHLKFRNRVFNSVCIIGIYSFVTLNNKSTAYFDYFFRFTPILPQLKPYFPTTYVTCNNQSNKPATVITSSCE